MSKTKTCSVCGLPLLASMGQVKRCAICGKIVCPRHIYSYLDADNMAITLNSPEICADCFKVKYPSDYREPSKNYDLRPLGNFKYRKPKVIKKL